MSKRILRRALGGLAALAALALPVVASAATHATGDRTLPAGTRFAVRVPDAGAIQQIASLAGHGDLRDAALLTKMETIPQAVWVTKGTPAEARVAARKAVVLAAVQRAVPVLVAYNIPGRDCGGLSAGGAQTPADYEAWIDGLAAGIGNSKAVVILEPDGLGLLPSNCGTGFPFSDDDRYAELNYAVDRLEAQPNTAVYLDGTHSAWLNTHDIATRLVRAGVTRAQGFFLNVSNFQYTENQVQYGTWISKCITLIASDPNFDCPSQYWNGGPNNGFNGVGLSPYGVWSDGNPQANLDSAGENLRLAGVAATTHFVVDTSRNGQGPWQFPSGTYTDPQDWCNPPNRGLGVRPQAAPVPSNPLVDAYLWVKTPGESDGQCTRGTAGPGDPARGDTVDPAAGQWFPQQALELAQLASPALLP